VSLGVSEQGELRKRWNSRHFVADFDSVRGAVKSITYHHITPDSSSDLEATPVKWRALPPPAMRGASRPKR
jgi:hypothetical protein